jgi:hypothetical protein
MLGRLLKYDIKSTGRVLLPLYGALLGAAVLLGFSLSPMFNSQTYPNSMGGGSMIMTSISSVLYVILIAAVAIVTLIMILYTGFYKSLLGAEGYLRFSLPVSTGQQLASKTINALIWMALAGVLAILSIIFLTVPAVGYTSIHQGIVQIFHSGFHVSPEFTSYMWQIILLAIAGGVSFVLKVFMSITVGHEWSAHPVVGALLMYIGVSILETVIANLLPVGSSLTKAMNAVSMDTDAAVHGFLWGTFAITLVMAAIFYAVTWYMLDRRLNLQ